MAVDWGVGVAVGSGVGDGVAVGVAVAVGVGVGVAGATVGMDKLDRIPDGSATPGPTTGAGRWRSVRKQLSGRLGE